MSLATRTVTSDGDGGHDEVVPTHPWLQRRRAGVRPAWRRAAAVVAVAVVAPVATVLVSLLTPTTEVWVLLWETRLVEMLTSTIVLMVGVVVGTVAIGGGLAWLTAIHDFPGRRALSWLLVLPLAMPAYVLGFVTIGLLDAPGPVQSVLRGLTGQQGALFNPRSMGMAVAVFTLALYPYVYLQARAALGEQSATPYMAARTLGLGPGAAARRVLLPLARPALAAGAALVAMETLTDFATVQYFNVTTVSVGVEQVWYGMYDRGAAAELASTVLFIAAAVILGERRMRGRARYDQRSPGSGITPIRLHGIRAVGAVAGCVAVLGVAFVVPAAQLAVWAGMAPLRGPGGAMDGRYLAYLGNSTVLALVSVGTCVVVGLVVTNAVRLSADRTTSRLAGIATIGYAVPGPVLAIGTLLLLATMDTGLQAAGVPTGGRLATGSVVAVAYAYTVRFLPLATTTLDAGLQRVPWATTASAATLGAPPRWVAARVHAPQLRSAIGIAAVLVAVDALKELPIVLLLRPFGFETLSLWVYRSAAEARWELAGLPALTIVAVASIPVVTLFRLQLQPGPRR